MRVLAVAQAFKETLSVSDVAEALEEGISRAGATPVLIRASDGGDGLLEALGDELALRAPYEVAGPLGRPVLAVAGWLTRRTVVIETPRVCGLALVDPAQRDVARSTTRGIGEIITQVEEEGATEIFLGLGGSATMDGGLGMARAWGWKPVGPDGQELLEGGAALNELAEIIPGRVPSAQIVGLVDVHNPLTGPGGARVFARQKGASPEQVTRLAAGLEQLARVTGESTKVALQPGAGAAGGLGFGLVVFARGRLVPGAEWFLARRDFEQRLHAADLVICGEGAFDATSSQGKLTGTVLDRARAAGKRAGVLAPRAEHVPDGVLVETGGGRWDKKELAARATLLIRRAHRSAARG